MKVYHLLYGASGLMVLGFLANVIADWFRYNATLNSAPLWVWILGDALIWLLPAALAFCAGAVCKKTFPNKEIKR